MEIEEITALAIEDRLALGWSEIDDLLSVRTLNGLRSACESRELPETIGSLVACTTQELLRTPNFGRKSLNEFFEFLDAIGLRNPSRGYGEVIWEPKALPLTPPKQRLEQRLDAIDGKLDRILELLTLRT